MVNSVTSTVCSRVTIIRAVKLFLCGILLLICLPSYSSTQEELHQKLLYADSIRSKDSEQLGVILQGINVHELRNLSDIDLFHYLNAHYFAITGDIETAIQKLHEIIATAHLEESRLRAYAKLAVNYMYLNQWEEAIYYGNLLSSKMDTIRTEELANYAVHTLANLYIKQGDNQAAINLLSGKLSPAIENKWQCVFAEQYAEATLSISAALTPSELGYIKHATELCKRIHEPYFYYPLIGHLSSYYLKQGKPHKALHLLEKDLESLKQLNIPPLLSAYYSFLLVAAFDASNFANTKQYALNILEMAKTISIPYSEKMAYQYLAKVTEQQGDTQKALAYYRAYQELVKVEFDENTARQLAILNGSIGAELREKSDKLKSIEAKLERTSEKLAAQEHTSKLLLVLLVVFLMLFSLGLSVRNRRSMKQLKLLQETDELTGASNRNHFNHRGHQLLTQCRRDGRPVSLILVDLDNLSVINDRFGHKTGDSAIEAMMKRVCTHSQEYSGLVGRIAGDEFAILLPNHDQSAAIELAEQCRLSIEHLDMSSTGFDFAMTASFGISDTEHSAYHLEKLFKHGDMALHQAKSYGFNQVKCYHPKLNPDISAQRF